MNSFVATVNVVIHRLLTNAFESAPGIPPTAVSFFEFQQPV
jgi:hypothetical protein